MSDVSGLPAGTVTFLFTDIEGSSEAWLNRPESMAPAIDLHNKVLREALATHSGSEIKHTGDGVCAVFSSAARAVDCATAMQVALQTASWPSGERLKVRMGMHTGEAVPSGDDYFGEVVTRAARVMDAANGDQIYSSSSSWSLAKRPGSVSTAFDCGEVQLKGLGNERIYSVRVPAMVSDKRPIRARPAGSGALPRNLQSFVGRSAMLDELATGIDLHRLITLVGVGGIGKSRLAIEFARRVEASFPDGMYWCELAPVNDPDDVAAAIASIVGVTPRVDMSMTQSLAAALDNQKALLIIDNCEHVLDAAREVLAQLLDTTFGPAVIATSRRSLRVRAEHVWPVTPLSEVQDQTKLFVDRALERDPHFDPSDVELAAIREICVRLDGLPLALELAAARIGVMTPSLMLERIDDRFALLGSRRDGTSERLRETVQWSYEQLREDEAELFRALAVFAGGFTLAGAHAVVVDMDEFDLLDALQALVDDSLLQRSGKDIDRFVMLETLRDFGFEKLDVHAERSTVEQRFANFVCAVVAEHAANSNSPQEFAAFDALDRERNNMRACFGWLTKNEMWAPAAEMVGSLFYYAAYTVQFEICEWAHELFGSGKIDDHPRVGDVAATASYGFYGRAALDQALDIAVQGVRLDPDSGPAYILGSMSSFGSADLQGTVRLLDDILARIDDQPASVQYWIASWKALYLEWVEGDPSARKWAERANEAALSTGGITVIAGGAWIRGVVTTSSDPERSVEFFRTALAQLGQRSGRNLIGHTVLEALVVLLTGAGSPEQALAACQENLVACLENDWVATTIDISSTVAACLKGAMPETAALLVGAADARGVFVRGRNYKALATFNDDMITAARSKGAGLSLRHATQAVVDAIDARLRRTPERPDARPAGDSGAKKMPA